MLGKFLEGFGGKMAESWVAAIMTPAFAFWAGALGAHVWRFGSVNLRSWFNQQPQLTQIAMLIGGLLVVATSGVIVQRFDLSALRLLEGYWPTQLRTLSRWLIARQTAKLDRAQARFDELANKGWQNINGDERSEYLALDWRLMLVPPTEDRRLPTRLGNAMRAAELRPFTKYGLDSVVCWPRLWLLLPDSVKTDLTEARSVLDSAARLWVWSLLFVIWTIWAWWAAPVGLLCAFFAYRWGVDAAEVYGSLLDSTFDLHRTLLYRSLRWPLPLNPADERKLGEQLTSYLWRGSEKSSPLFTTGG